jgi:NADPH-dependent glutamate synthase beta subunit-like oxidoreductase
MLRIPRHAVLAATPRAQPSRRDPRTDFVRTDGRVAIVGAGAAGVTAAAAFAVAAPEPKQIDLFEKCDGLLHLQQESDR